MKKGFLGSIMVTVLLGLAAGAPAAVQDGYDLPEPYLDWERAYLREFPDLQALMDVMVGETAAQLTSPGADILHNRVCATLVYRMAGTLAPEARRLALAADLLHNISKEDKKAVLTRPEVFDRASQMVAGLREAGYFKASPRFWTEEAVLRNPKVGDNLGLVHHITGAVRAGEIAGRAGGYSRKEIDELQVAIVQHSTGYWYFRASVDEAAGRKGAWESVYPEPENDIARLAHDADLISQFVPESVVPDGSKWRELAKKRWGAKETKEEGQIVYYVFLRLFEEAKTPTGREMAREKWEEIRPELVRLMGLAPGDDPIKALGVPKIFQ
jgi:hypothetical protein